MMLQFSLLIWTLPLQEINGCRTYLTRSERGGARAASTAFEGENVPWLEMMAFGGHWLVFHGRA